MQNISLEQSDCYCHSDNIVAVLRFNQGEEIGITDEGKFHLLLIDQDHLFDTLAEAKLKLAVWLNFEGMLKGSELKPIFQEYKNKLARDFADALKKEIGADNMKEVIRRNATPEYVDCCASHDFCDANQVLIDVLESTGFMEDFDFLAVEFSDSIFSIAHDNDFFQGGENGK